MYIYMQYAFHIHMYLVGVLVHTHFKALVSIIEYTIQYISQLGVLWTVV